MIIEKKIVSPVYEYHLVLTEKEARELKDTLGEASGSYDIFHQLTDILNLKSRRNTTDES